MKKTTMRLTALFCALVMILSLAGCSHEHEYGEWQYDAERHSRSCTVRNCEELEAGEHSFGAGEVLKEATTEAQGEMKYTCTVCGYYYTETTDQLFEITLREIETWDIHTSLQKKYLADTTMTAVNYAQGTAELSYPNSLTFNWEAKGFNDERVLDHYNFYLGEKEDLSDAECYTSRWNDYTKNNGGFNFKVNTTYYWKAEAVLTNGEVFSSKISSFTTLGGIRNMYVDGVANFRDLGGKDCDGGVLRQGLIYRCGRLHEGYSAYLTVKVSKNGIKTLKALGIKSEIDLRGKIKDGWVENGDLADGSRKVTTSVIGEDVQYFHPGAEYSDTMLQTVVGKTMVRDTFAILADENNYPLLFHCSIGTDRTGIIAILTEGVCGVDEKTILQDYLFSNFGNIGSSRLESRYNTVVAAIKACSGSTFQKKCENYLLKCGVTAEQIANVREILIEKK